MNNQSESCLFSVDELKFYLKDYKGVIEQQQQQQNKQKTTGNKFIKNTQLLFLL